LGIASILSILFKFSIDSCIAILFYSSYIATQMEILFWKSTNFEFLLPLQLDWHSVCIYQ